MSDFERVEPRKFFATIKNELKEFELQDLLMERTKGELRLYAYDLEKESKLTSKLHMRGKLYGTAIELAILLVLIVFLVVFALNDWRTLSIILAIVILIFLVVSNIGRMRGKSWTDDIGKSKVLNDIQLGKLELKDEELDESIAAAEAELEDIDAQINEKSTQTKYFQDLPEKYRSLYSINRLYEISREQQVGTIAETYEIYDIEDAEHAEKTREEQAEREDEIQGFFKF